MSKKPIRSLIEAIFQNGEYSDEGAKAIKELAAFGEAGVDAMLRALKHFPGSDLHPKDLWDSIQATFCQFARVVPDKLLDELEKGKVDPALIYWALGYAKGDRSLRALIAGLGDTNLWVRWTAVESLIRRRSKKAIPALIQALRDRSPTVKFPIVWEMKTRADYRRPEALPLLERIVNSKSLRKRNPGLWEAAELVIRKIRREMGSTRRLRGAGPNGR